MTPQLQGRLIVFQGRCARKLRSQRLNPPSTKFLRAKGHKMIEGLLQPMHLLVIFGIALLVFGPKKLPELGKGIGDGIRGFKSAMKDQDDSSDKSPAAKDEGPKKV